MNTDNDGLCNGLPFDELWHDDGNAFMCSRCGTVTPRTRMNPYPKMRHTPVAKLQAPRGMG